MQKVKVLVTLKPSLLDAQGKVVQDGLHALGYAEVEGVRIGKVIELNLADGTTNAHEQVREMCQRFLANTVIENYEIEVLQ